MMTHQVDALLTEKDLAAYQQRMRQGADRPARAGGSPTTPKHTPTARYDRRNINGWTVYVSPQLMDRPGLCETMATLLTYKLHMIDHFISPQGQKQLHQV